MEIFEMEGVYTHKALVRLFSVRENLLHPVRTRMIQLVSIGLIALGVFLPDRPVVSLPILFVGCVLLTNTGKAARRAAKTVEERMTMPFSVSYSFDADHFVTCSSGQTTQVRYAEITCFLADREYGYLFDRKGTGYLLSWSSGSGGDALKAALSKRLGRRCWPAGCAALLAAAQLLRGRR